MKKAKIAEIFKSCQGEGLWQGKEQIFVRFFGCNQKCRFCDTILSWCQLMSLEQVLGSIEGLGGSHSVSLTGGEPLLQVDFLEELASYLQEKKRTVYLETNGTLPDNLRKVIGCIDMISMDFKLPSSTGGMPLWEKHERFLEIAKETGVFGKAIIAKSTVIEDLDRTIDIIKSVKPDLSLVLQAENPYESELKEKTIDFKKRCIDKAVNTLITTQLHKKIGIK